MLLELTAFADAQIEAARAGLRAAGLVAERLELHQAVRALLDDAQAEERWRAGGEIRAAGGRANASE